MHGTAFSDNSGVHMSMLYVIVAAALDMNAHAANVS